MATMEGFTMEGFISKSDMMLAAFWWRGGGSCDATEDSNPGEVEDNAGDGGFDYDAILLWCSVALDHVLVAVDVVVHAISYYVGLSLNY